MSFLDARLDETVSYGFRGGPRFLTTVVELRSGKDRRNAERLRPKYYYRAPYNAINEDNFAALQAAYIACLGPAYAFRFKDWADYQLDDVAIGTADGTTDQQIQIIKPYVISRAGAAVRTVNRKIEKPVDSTVYNKANGYRSNAVALSVTANDTPIAFNCDYDTGMITLTGTNGHTIKVTGEFDVPVRFVDDALEFDFVEWRAHSTDIALVEVWDDG